MKSVLNIHWRDWCWNWNSNTLAIWWEVLTHLKRPWCWERLKVEREGDDRGWDGWMASPTQWTWVWVNSKSWWWTGRPSVLQSMGSQRVKHDWATELNWTDNDFLTERGHRHWDYEEGATGGSDGKESTCNAGDWGWIPGLGTVPGEGNGNLLQYSCLGNPMDRGSWWATVHGVTRVI